MKIQDNFLTEKEFLNIQSTLMSSSFPWYYNPAVVTMEDLKEHFQFTHTFYSEYESNSEYIKLLHPLIDIIKPLSILRIKANLLTKTSEHVEHGLHVDCLPNVNSKITTGILYINTNNGYTKFKNGNKVQSIKNKYIEFDATELHTGSTCTDENTRIVINFNYIK